MFENTPNHHSSATPMEFTSLRLVQRPRWIKPVSVLLSIVFILTPIGMIWLPWQQSVRGWGRVIAMAPLERQQTIKAPINGRVVRWWVQEGSQVAPGDRLVEISDIDPAFMERLQTQREALNAKNDRSRDKVASYEQQLDNLTATRDLSVSAAAHRVSMAREKLRSAEASAVAAQAGLQAAEAQLQRHENLLSDGLVSTRDFDVAKRDHEMARMTVDSSNAAARSAADELRATEVEQERIRTEFDARIDSARASLHDAQAQLQESLASLAKIEIDVSRQQSQVVVAPRPGIVFRLQVAEGGEIVKAGEPLLTLVPQTSDRAVELWVSGNDAPLVRPGDPVRLQFEGWPAVQFVGWPSVAIGTFGGKVAMIDSTDNGKGQFRLMAVADPAEPPWPDVRYLRQGVRAKGWVLLNRVALGYEVWRQLNGFPPVIADAEPKMLDSGSPEKK